MTAIASSPVHIQTSEKSVPSIPGWFGEVAVFARVLSHTGILTAIQEEVRFARARFGTYDVIDFTAVLIGYAVSGEPTLLAFYERLAPFAEVFMALFGRHRLPHRSTLSRFLAALDQSSVEALRQLFQKDLLARSPFPSPGGLFDRIGADSAILIKDEEVEASRFHLTAGGWHHVPIQSHNVVVTDRFRASEDIAFCNELFVRTRDYCFDRCMPAALGQLIGVATVLCPERGDAPAAEIGVRFVPDRDVPVHKFI